MARASDFATPGRLRNAQAVRRDMAWLVSQAEIAVARGQNPEAAFVDIRAFLTSVLAKVNSVAPVYLTSAVASPTSILANNTATSTITATITANGVAVGAGTTVNFALSGPQAATCTLSAASAVTGAGGTATVTVKGSAAGSVTVTATANGKSGIATVTLT